MEFANVVVRNKADLVPAATLGQQLGCELMEPHLLRVDEAYRTTVPDVWAAGGCSAMPQLALAIATGNLVGEFKPGAYFRLLMSLFSYLLLAAGLALTLPAAPALAQKAPKEPPTLLGRWETRQVRFSAPGPVPDSTLSKLDSPDIIDLNGAIFTGEAHLAVEFRPDSTYAFTINRNGKNYRTETGTYSLRGNHLNASAPASADGSSFHDQQVQRLARRVLVLSFLMGPEFPGVSEEVEYRRVGPYPDKK